MPPAIYSIPAEQPFLDTLVAGLMRRAGKAPLALAGMTVLLPTRRAARSLREAFLRAGEWRGDAAAAHAAGRRSRSRGIGAAAG